MNHVKLFFRQQVISLLIFCLAFTSLFGILVKPVLALEVIIDPSVSNNANSHNTGTPTTVFIDRSIGYQFYRDASGACVYSKTSDGGNTWGNAVTVDSQTDCVRVNVWYDQWTPGDSSGTYIHIATMDTGDDDLFYTRLDTSTDSLTTTVSTTTGQAGAYSINANIQSITKGTDGVLYMAMQDIQDSFMVKCSATCTSSGNWSEAGTNPFDLESDLVILMPLLGDDIIAIRWDLSADTIDSKVYDSSANTWSGSWTTIDNTAQEAINNPSAFGATLDKVSGTIYLTYGAVTASTTLHEDVRTAIYSSGSWTLKTNVYTNHPEGIADTKIAIDSSNGDIYVAYVARINSAQGSDEVFYKVSTDGMNTWSSEVGPISDTAGNLHGLSINLISDDRLYTVWESSNSDQLSGTTLIELIPNDPVLIASAQLSLINSILAGSTDVDAGAAFTFQRGTGSTNVTQINIKAKGTIVPNTQLSNLSVYYKTETNCSDTRPIDATIFNVIPVAFNGSGIATVTGSMSVTTSRTCVYLEYDVAGGVTVGTTIDFEITNASTDITVSSDTVDPNAVVDLPGQTVITDSIIDIQSDDDENIFSGSGPTIVFVNDDVGYAFFKDENNQCVYRKSTDKGLSWNVVATVDSQTDCLGIKVWWDQWTPGNTSGTYIHAVTYDRGSDALYYTRLDTSSDTLTTTVTISGAQGGSFSSGQNYPYITLATNGVIYAGIQDGSDSYVVKCSTTCTTAGNWSEAGTNPFDTDNDWLILMPLASDNIMAIRWDISANAIQSKIYTAGSNSWAGSWTNIDTATSINTSYDAPFSAVVDKVTNDIYMAWVADNSTFGTNDDVRTAIYSSGSWTLKTDVLSNNARGLTNVAIGFDDNTADVYVAYTARSTAGTATTANVFYKRSKDGMTTWLAESGQLNSLTGDLYGLSINIWSTERLYAMWYVQATRDVIGNNIADLAIPKFDQSAYRFFNNSDSTNVGAALAAQDTPITLASAGDEFRLRITLHMETLGIRKNYENYKLQFVDQGTGTCASPTGGTPATYTDVTAGTAIAYKDNATPADGASLTGNANDPLHSGHSNINQTYEELNNFTNSVAKVYLNEDGMWDFSLHDNGAPGDITYCFRVVKSTGATIQVYGVYPQITTANSVLTVDIVDAGGTPVASPSVVFSPVTLDFSDTISSATFGVSAERIRVNNMTANPQWVVSLAADAGATAFWDGAASDFDFNDPTADAGDGGDTDSFGGQMTLDPSVATITPQGGCTNTGLTLGSSSSFSEGVTDSITIITAGAGADVSCYWDITGIDVDQTIPPEQASDSYNIDMTLSIIAI